MHKVLIILYFIIYITLHVRFSSTLYNINFVCWYVICQESPDSVRYLNLFPMLNMLHMYAAHFTSFISFIFIFHQTMKALRIVAAALAVGVVHTAITCYNSSLMHSSACIRLGDYCTNLFSFDSSGELQLVSAGCNSHSPRKCRLCQTTGPCEVTILELHPQTLHWRTHGAGALHN